MRNPFLFNLQSTRCSTFCSAKQGWRDFIAPAFTKQNIDVHTKAKEGKAYLISVLLLGFLSGNLFGTILDFLRRFVMWDLFIIATLLFVIEFIGFIAYNPRVTKRSFVLVSKIKAINFFKVGMMIGFFVDAFKVGS